MNNKFSLLIVLFLLFTSGFSRDIQKYLKKEKWQYTKYVDHAGVRYLPLKDEKKGQILKNQNTIWKACGYAKYTDEKGKLHEFIYLGAANHANDVAIYEYSINEDKITGLGIVSDLMNLTDWDWQAKIHTYFLQNPNDGLVYFGVECGEHKAALREHTTGFHGGYFGSIDPKTKEVKNLGRVFLDEPAKCIALDWYHNRIYAVTPDISKWLVYDIKTKKIKNYGIYNGWHTPRAPFIDKWGNGYTNDTYGYIVKFIASENKLIHTGLQLPHGQYEPLWMMSQGVSAYAYGKDSSKIYCSGIYNRIFVFKPENGRNAGTIEDLGSHWMQGDKYYYKDWDREFYNRKSGGKTMIYHPSEKIYWGTGGEVGHVLNHIDSLAGREYLLEYDLKTKKRRIVHHFNERVLTLIDGPCCVDSKGVIYFGGIGQSFFSGNYIINAPRKPYIIIVDPSKLKPEEYVDEGKYDENGIITAHPVNSPWVK